MPRPRLQAPNKFNRPFAIHDELRLVGWDDDWLDEDGTGLPALSPFRAAACASGTHSAAPSCKEALEKGGTSALHELGSFMLGELQQLHQLHA